MRLIERTVSFVAAVLMFALMILTVVDVAGRNLFHHPLLGATELTEITLVLLSFLLFPVVAFASRHIVADVADVFQSRLLNLLQVVLTAVLGGGFFALIAWRLWILAGQAGNYGDRSVSLGIPLAPVLYVIAVLAGITALAFVARGLQARTESAPGRAEDPVLTDSLL